ncbi:MAG: hypothetical protein JWP02_4019 [Acidimicrobiales bacterium]|nr:hypothetical protein [Acidimicrobiales bacterium]
MSEDHLEREVLGDLGLDRRSFVKKLVLGAAFAVPVISSFDMLTSSVAGGATCTASNGSFSGSGDSGSGLQGGAGGTRQPTTGEAACGGDPFGGTGGAGITPNATTFVLPRRRRRV